MHKFQGRILNLKHPGAFKLKLGFASFYRGGSGCEFRPKIPVVNHMVTVFCCSLSKPTLCPEPSSGPLHVVRARQHCSFTMLSTALIGNLTQITCKAVEILQLSVCYAATWTLWDKPSSQVVIEHAKPLRTAGPPESNHQSLDSFQSFHMHRGGGWVPKFGVFFGD